MILNPPLDDLTSAARWLPMHPLYIDLSRRRRHRRRERWPPCTSLARHEHACMVTARLDRACMHVMSCAPPPRAKLNCTRASTLPPPACRSRLQHSQSCRPAGTIGKAREGKAGTTRNGRRRTQHLARSNVTRSGFLIRRRLIRLYPVYACLTRIPDLELCRNF